MQNDRVFDSWQTIALRLAALASFAVCQPLLDLLGRFPEFLSLHLNSRSQLFVLAALFGLLPLVGAFLIVGGSFRFSATLRRVMTVVFGLPLLVALLSRWAIVAGMEGWSVVGIAVGGAFGCWLVYRRLPPFRQLASFAAIGLLGFPLVFLLGPGGQRLLRALGDGEPVAAAGLLGSERPPIVFVVLDEFGSQGLVDRSGTVDPELYPHLAAFSEEALWYPYTVAASDATVLALPALVTGRLPEPDSLPLLADHPRNLFTMLSEDYRIWASEPSTRLCPPELNERTGFVGEASTGSSLLTDLAVIYAHLVLPKPWSESLPPIDQAWGSFAPDRSRDPDETMAARGAARRRIEEAAIRANRSDRLEAFETLRERATRVRSGELVFGHFMLPHVPWEYLPSGKKYSIGGGTAAGLVGRRWGSEVPELLVGARERYQAQVRFVDRLVGELIDELKRAGHFEETLIVLTADHGTSFVSGEPRRAVNPRTARELLAVPLWIKPPRSKQLQTRLGVQQRLASSIDVLPTVLDLLGVASAGNDVAEAGTGRSLLDEPARERALVQPMQGDRATFDRALFALRDPQARRDELVGTRITTVARRAAAGGRLLAAPETTVQYQPETSIVPAWWSAVLEPDDPGDDSWTVALAVNEKIVRVRELVGVTGATQLPFGLLLPEEAFLPGDNHVEAFRILARDPLVLAPFAGPEPDRDRLIFDAAGDLSELIWNGVPFAVVKDPATVGRLARVDDSAGALTAYGWASGAGDTVVLTVADRVVAVGELFVAGGVDNTDNGTVEGDGTEEGPNRRRRFAISLDEELRDEIELRGTSAWVVDPVSHAAVLLATSYSWIGDELLAGNGRQFASERTITDAASFVIEPTALSRNQLIVEFDGSIELEEPVELLVFAGERRAGRRRVRADLAGSRKTRVRVPLRDAVVDETAVEDWTVLLVGGDGELVEVPASSFALNELR